MDWDDLRVFLAVLRRRSHKGAARALAVDPTTIGRRIGQLEEALGAKLFLRTPEGLDPTPAARTLAVRAERVEAEVLASMREIAAADERAEGTLRVSASDGIAHYRLIPALVDLRRQHPALELELVTQTGLADLSRREADVALRLVRPKDASLVARRVGPIRFGLFASTAWIDRHGVPRAAKALAGQDWIGFDASLDPLPQVEWLRRTVGEPRYVLRATATTTQVLACAEGNGVALLPTFVADAEPRLRHLLPRLAPPDRDVWAVTHGDLRGSAKVEAFFDWVAALWSR